MGLINKLFSSKTETKSNVQLVNDQQNQPSKLEFNDIKELLMTPTNNETDIELKRKEAYIDRPTQKLLRDLLETKNSEILPSYDISHGFRYANVESILKENSSQETEALLDRLTKLKILEKTFFETVSTCPNCESPSITLHYRCPKCSSHHVTRTSLTEHIPCGNMDERDKYNRENYLPTCPKCGKELVKGEYRDLGRWFVCRECKDRFEHADLDVICRKCGSKFSVDKIAVREISKYNLNRELESEIRQNVTSLENIEELLTDLGFSVEMPGSVIGGKSGILYYFGILAKKKFKDSEKIITVDYAVGDPEVSASQVIIYSYKVSEIKSDVPIFIAIPKLGEVAKKIAQGYNILVLEEIPNDKKQVAALNDEIQKRLSESVTDPQCLPKVEEITDQQKMV